MKSSLLEQYQKGVRAKLKKEFGIKNPMQVPSIQKICINVGMGSYLQKLGSKDFSFVSENLTLIAGQMPVVRNAKSAISNFKLRQGMPVGMAVTLRKEAAYNFLYKLIHVVYPRVRDFRGVDGDTFDKDGNCSFGIKDYTVFPEAERTDDVRRIFGLQITVVFNTTDAVQNKRLLEEFGFPFKKSAKKID
jgi:large subunit ribosomal protein L5